MEAWAAIDNSLGVFCHAAVEIRICATTGKIDRVEVASAKTTTATHAVFSDGHFLRCFVKLQAVVRTFAQTAFAAAAFFRIDLRLAVAVLLLLAGAGTAAHADVLDRAAKAGELVALKCASEMKMSASMIAWPMRASLTYSPPTTGHRNVVRALEPVADDHRTTNRQRCEAIFPGAVEMLDGVLTKSRIHRVAVGEKWFARRGL